MIFLILFIVFGVVVLFIFFVFVYVLDSEIEFYCWVVNYVIGDWFVWLIEIEKDFLYKNILLLKDVKLERY